MRRWLTPLTVLAMTLALTAPVFAQTVLFGPQQYARTAGPPNQFTDTFTLPTGTTAPYTLHVVNGNANGTNRISSATVKLNGVEILDPNDFGQNVAVLDRTVALQASNTLEIRLTSAPGSVLTVTVLDTNAGTQPTALTPSPLHLAVGATGTLTATLTPAPTAAGSLTVSSANPAVATVPASVAFAAGQTNVPIPVTAVASGTTTVTVSFNGGSAASQVDVALPPPTVTGFTPTSGQPGTSVTMTGTNFVNVQTVQFNGVLAPTFTVANTTTLTAVVPPTATTGPLAVTTLAGTGTNATNFTVIPAPTIASLQPATLTIVRGNTGTLTVTLSAVQTTATAVTLASSNTAVATIPGTVSVPATQLSAPVTVTAVSLGSADLTASLNGTSATSTITVVNPVPAITTVSPTSVPSGSPNTTLTVTGQQFVTGAVVTFGTTALATTFVSATQLTATVPAALLTAKGTVPVTVENPAPGGGASTSLPFTIVNGAPVLTPIGNQTVPLGSTLTFTATATDPDNDPVQFAATPVPLLAHASFNAQTGLFVFTPDATQVGTVPLTISASDGIATVSESITLTVTGAPPGGITGVSGRVVDGSGQPIANLVVTVKATGQTGTTTALGQFTITGITVSGRQVLLANGLPLGYAILAAPVDLIPNVMNNLASDLRVPAIDVASAVTVNPATTTVLSNPSLPNTTVTIAPNTAKNPDGTNFTGALSISPVPEYGRPESRPVELKPGFSITIQPAGITLTTPAPITLPNTDNLPVGNELDLWSLSPDTGTFYVAGRMRVSADGTKLETISGGVRKTAWHFALSPNPSATPPEDPSFDDCPECQGMGSGGRLADGALTHDVTISGIRTLGASRDLTFHYRSTSADVQPIVPVNAFLSVRAAVPRTFSASLKLGGTEVAGGLYWNSSGLPENLDSTSRLGLQFHGASLPTGRYPVDLTLYSNYPQSSIGGTSSQQILVRNEQTSPFGAGWTLAGVDRLIPQANGGLILAEGNGTTRLFSAQKLSLNLVSWWAGEGAANDIGGGNHGTLQNGATIAAGFVGEALSFDGDDDFVNVPGSATLDRITTATSVEAWINPQVPPGHIHGYLFARRDPFFSESFSVTLANDGRLELVVKTTTSPTAIGTVYTTTPGVLRFGQWQHVAATVNTTANQVKVYVNGQELPLSIESGPATISGALFNVNNLFIGQRQSSATAEGVEGGGHYQGLLDELTLYSVELSASQIQAIVAAGSAGKLKPAVIEDFGAAFDTVRWTLQDQAVQDATAGTLQLTTAQAGVFGRAFYRLPFRAERFHAVFDYTIAGGTGGDGLTFAWVQDMNYPPSGGGGLDFTGATGYAVEFDTWVNSWDPAGRHVGLIRNSTETHLATQLIETRGTHHVAIDFDRGQGVVVVDGTQVLTVAIPNYVPYDAVFGFTGATGGATDVHTIDNFRLTFNAEEVPGFQSPSGDFSTLIKNADSTYTRTMKDGTVYQFNAQGYQTAKRDRNGNTTTYASNGSNQLTTITDPAGQVTTLAYNGSWLQSITDAAGRTTTLTHDGAGNLTGITQADGTQETFNYDANHRLVDRRDARGQRTQYQYDYAKRFATSIKPTGETASMVYAQRTAVPDVASGQGTASSPAALSTSTVNRATYTDANGKTTTFELDALRRVIKQTDPLNRTTLIERDAQGNPTKITRPNGAITTMTYDAKGNLLTSSEQSISATTTFAYEPVFNQVSRITDPKGNQTNITYDVKGNPITITDADNKVTTFTYDVRGLLLTSKDALNQTTTFTYDALGRLLTTTDPLNRTTTLTYDTAGNVATSTDALNRVTAFEYDAKNRLKKVTDPLGGITQYTYDANGNLLTVKDAKNQVTAFAYDSRNRLMSTTDPLGKVETYTYDGNDNLTKRITPKLDQIVFAYDAVNQLLSKSLPGNLLTSYQYDPVGNLTSVTDPDSALTMTYDQANRLLTASTAGSSNQPSVTVTYTYDKNGNRLTAVDPAGTNTYTYDPLNRLASLASPAGLATLTYDALSRRTSLTLPNGTSTSYTYDAASQVQSILHKITATNTPINNADYLYNPVGDRTQLTDRRGAQTFGYDNLDRLTSASHPLLGTAQSFAYDPVGNRTTGGSVVNAGNQLTVDANYTYQYDDNGNLIRKTLLATGNFSQYTYDAENRLIKVEDFTAGNPTPTVTSTYRYDGLGRRIEKTGNGVTHRYVYDGEDILLEYDGSNVLQARYTQGPGIDEPMMRTPLVPGVGSGHTAVLASTSDGLTGPVVDDGLSVNGQVFSGFTLASGVPTPAIGQPITATGSHQPVAPINVTTAAATGTLAVDLIDTGGIGGNAPVYLVTRDTGTNQVLNSQLLFAARLTFASTTPTGTPQVMASTTVPVSTAVANSTLFYHQDGLGTVTELTDTNGSVAKSYAYDAYGTILESSGTVEQPYTYTGREFDSESGLYYYRERYYDSLTGRFLQKDPIGFIGGFNLYQYVRGNPALYNDPRGLLAPFRHRQVTRDALASVGRSCKEFGGDLTQAVSDVDFAPGSQDRENAIWHAMTPNGMPPEEARAKWDEYVSGNLGSCTPEGLANALHAGQDYPAGGHNFKKCPGAFLGIPGVGLSHFIDDLFPSDQVISQARTISESFISQWIQKCGCTCPSQ